MLIHFNFRKFEGNYFHSISIHLLLFFGMSLLLQKYIIFLTYGALKSFFIVPICFDFAAKKKSYMTIIGVLRSLLK